MNTRVIQTLPGIISAGLIIALVLSAIIALISQANELNPLQIWQDPYLRHVSGFSFYQALLSTLLSIIPAIPTAYALSRRQFPGRSLLLRLFAMTLVLPVLVAVFGLLTIYGRSGLLAEWLNANGQSLPFSIYGLNGILLAHVFFNYPPRNPPAPAKPRGDPVRAASACNAFGGSRAGANFALSLGRGFASSCLMLLA